MEKCVISAINVKNTTPIQYKQKTNSRQHQNVTLNKEMEMMSAEAPDM